MQDQITTCRRCGGPLHKGASKYCSRSCYGASRTGNNHHNHKPKIAVQCAHCGVMFEAYPYKIADAVRSGHLLYCSVECGHAARKNRTPRAYSKVTLTCEHCGSRFDTWPHRVKDGAKYCSHTCYWAVKGRDADPRDRGLRMYRDWRTAVFRRDGYRCQHCGQLGGTLHAHHVKSWATHPESRFDVSNGLTLCRACHRLEHTTAA